MVELCTGRIKPFYGEFLPGCCGHHSKYSDAIKMLLICRALIINGDSLFAHPKGKPCTMFTTVCMKNPAFAEFHYAFPIVFFFLFEVLWGNRKQKLFNYAG